MGGKAEAPEEELGSHKCVIRLVGVGAWALAALTNYIQVHVLSRSVKDPINSEEHT